MKCMKFDDQDKEALRALSSEVTFSKDGEVATFAGEVKIDFLRPAQSGNSIIFLTIMFPGGETLDLTMTHDKLLERDE